ncbi:DUF6404 family protein [Pantoea cypripedii]|uniref:Uncharacterized protein n=1 Tax=Pantoea cypripedii TaxID=55209 RepID=A0A6B9G7Z3_PANCY|nr:DUF6404 family protein [Pantoea cypripedii]QGY32702.1 hypothetical protein CUN67_27545 [Pantoea cypripedii]
MVKDAEFIRKKTRAIDIMASKGMWSSNYAPPLHRLLWKLGVNIPPPPFTTFRSNMFIFSIMFGPAWGLMMWLILWKNAGNGLVSVLLTSVCAGLLFGFSMAAFHYWRKVVNKLPAWDQL